LYFPAPREKETTVTQCNHVCCSQTAYMFYVWLNNLAEMLH
jgi:hypothetical protein